MTRSQFAIAALILGLVLGLVPCSYAKDKALRDLRSKWVGEYPSKGNQNILNDPRIKEKLTPLVGTERFKHLLSGDYLMSRIDYVGGYFVLEYAANLHILPEIEHVYVIIREYTGSLHVAIQDKDDKVKWMHSNERDLPGRIQWMLGIKYERMPNQ